MYIGGTICRSLQNYFSAKVVYFPQTTKRFRQNLYTMTLFNYLFTKPLAFSH